MIFKIKNRAGFSMLELVFVIVILGIVASIGSEIIAKVYKSYIIQRASNKSSIKTELAALQIANRLAYVIPNTVIGRVSADDDTYKSINEILPSDNFQVLEWVGYDADSFKYTASGTLLSGWSGFVDLNHANTGRDTIASPGSHIVISDTVIGYLSGGGTPKKNTTNGAIFFPGVYDVNNIGYNGNISGIAKPVTRTINKSTFDLAPIPAGETRVIKEFYKLAWSAYAIVPVIQPDNGLWEIRLYYDLQPWNGIDYDSQGVKSKIFLRNVSVFQFSGSENTIRFKLCQQEWIDETNKITTCKEKAVIR